MCWDPHRNETSQRTKKRALPLRQTFSGRRPADPVLFTAKCKLRSAGRSGPRGCLLSWETKPVGQERMPHAATQNGHQERPLGRGRLSKGLEVRGVVEELPRTRRPNPLDRPPDVPGPRVHFSHFRENLPRHKVSFCGATAYNVFYS